MILQDYAMRYVWRLLNMAYSWMVGGIEDFFHLYKRKYAMPFLARRKGGYWWKEGSFGIFSGRRMFLNWLIWKYRDDETNLLDL